MGLLSKSKKAAPKEKVEPKPKAELMHTCKPRDKTGCMACAEK